MNIHSIPIPRDIITVSVNMIEGDILLTCTYAPDINPKEYKKLSKGKTVYSFCSELHNLDILGFKLCTIFRLQRLKKIYVLTKDGSPHSMQIPLMVQEAAEDTGFDKKNVQNYCFEKGKLYSISDLTIRKARHYSEIERLLPYSKLEKVVEILRGKDGCKNDKKETFLTVTEHLREEVNEIEAAIKAKDTDNLLEEIGDVLFNLALMAQIAKEQGSFELTTVTHRVAQKMIDKHPDVFSNKTLKY